MKRNVYLWLAAVMLAGMLVTFAGAQSDSLGDYARAVRKEKKAPVAKQFDNDNLPKTDKLSVVGSAREETAEATAHADKSADAQAAAPTDDQAQPAANPDQKSEDKAANKTAGRSGEKQQMYDDWKKKIADQKDQVGLLSRELDVLQREYRLRAAAFYADAGNRLRSSSSWDQEDKQYKSQLADKQKAVDKAKQDLEDLQEQARKAGVPASARE